MSEIDISKIQVPRFKTINGFKTTPKYSGIMKKIRAKNTKPEVIFRKTLWKSGLRYRINTKDIPGRPDLIIRKFKLAIFIDGDFWHGYNWTHKKTKIKSNLNYWVPKIERNMQRDLEITKLLTERKWTVLRFWEHQIHKNLAQCVMEVIEIITLLQAS